jgi:predicted nucleic acid-binding protein
MRVVCFDNNVMIWGIKEQATPGQEYMIDRTKRFLAHLDKQGDKAMLPAPIVGEFLLNVDDDFHSMTINLLQRSFIIQPFDLQAAALFARIWRKHARRETLQELQSAGNVRGKLRVDCMIVAIAAAKGAACIYSHDDGVRKFSSGFIDCFDIPDIPTQNPLL